MGKIYPRLLTRPHLEENGQLYNFPPPIIYSLMFWEKWCSEPGFLAHSLLWRNGIETEPDCEGVQGRASRHTVKEQTETPFEGLFQYYPNPAYNSITVECLKEIKDFRIAIYDSQGKARADQEVKAANGPVTLPLIDLSPGLYFIAVHSSDGRHGCKKLVISR